MNTVLDFSREVAPADAGLSESGVAGILAEFEGQWQRGLHPAAQLVVVRRGRVLLDRAVGRADVRSGRPATPGTPFCAFSFGKMFLGVAVHQLIEAGRIELDAPVAEYWPEFGCKGKQTATIRHAFTHRAGIPLRGLYRQVWGWPDWERTVARVAALPAEWPPGTRMAYHLVNFGFILGEVARRVTGLPVPQLLRERVFEPLGLRDTYLGVPQSELGRVARLYSGHIGTLGAALQFDRPSVRRAVVPAGNLHTTARETATLLQMLLDDGEYAGQRLLRPETVAFATSLGAEGYDETQRGPRRWGHGFQLGGDFDLGGGQVVRWPMGRGSTPRTFGHFALGSSMSWADPASGLIVVHLTNRLLPSAANTARHLAISDAVWGAANDE